MPARQRGSTVRRGKSWAVRWYDEGDVRQFRSGFATKSEARDCLDSQVADVEALRRGDVAALRRRDMPTLKELVDEFTAQHVAETSSIAALKYRLRYAVEGPKLDGEAGWQDLRIDRLNPTEIGAWRKALPARSAFGIHKALRQVLHYAVRAKLLDENAASLVPNPEPKRTEVQTFSLAELDAVSGELARPLKALPVFAALTGLRPCEWIALERADVDRRAGIVTVRRTVVDGVVKPYGKTSRSLRAVPLPARAAEALDEHLPRPTPVCSSPERVEDRWHFRRSVIATGVRHFGLPASPTGRSTRCDTPTRACRSPQACRSSSCPGSGNVAGNDRQDLRAHAPGRPRSGEAGTGYVHWRRGTVVSRIHVEVTSSASPPFWARVSTSSCSNASVRDTRAMRVCAVVVLAAMPLLLGAWTLSDNGVSPWRPKGKAVVKTPDGVSLVIRSSFCSFGRHGYVRLRFGGKPTTTDGPYMQLVAHTREGKPAVLDIFDGVINLGPKWADAPNRGIAHVQVARRRGTFVLFRPGDATGQARYTGSWHCG